MQIWQIYEHIYKHVYATISSNEEENYDCNFSIDRYQPRLWYSRSSGFIEFAVSTHRQSHMISDSRRCLLWFMWYLYTEKHLTLVFLTAWWKSLNPRAGLFVGLYLFCGFNWFLILCHSQPGGVILEGRGWWMGYQRDAVENDYVLRSRDSSCISAAAQTGKWQLYQIVGKDEIIN